MKTQEEKEKAQERVKVSLRGQQRHRRVRRSKGIFLSARLLFGIVGFLGVLVLLLIVGIRFLRGGAAEWTSAPLPSDESVVSAAFLDVEGDELKELIVARLTPAENESVLRIAVIDAQALIQPQGSEPVSLAGLYRARGVRGLLEKTTDLVGFRVDGYMTASRRDLVHLTDALGGITLNIPEAVHHDDNVQGVHIHLPAGQHVLDGEKVLEYLASPESDPAETQRAVAAALLVRILEDLKNGRPMEPVLQAVLEPVQTNLSAASWLEWVDRLDDAGPARVILASVTGPAEGTPFPLQSERLKDFLGSAVPDLPRSVMSNATPVESPRPEPVRVRILNGDGTPRVAASLAQRLERDGAVRVIETANADHFNYEQTIIIDLRNRPAAAQNLLERIGLGRIEQRSRPNSDVDLLVILGHDFRDQERRAGRL